MNKTYTISQEKLEEIFESLEVMKDLRDRYEKKGNKEWYQKYLSEWIGSYCTIVSLGLLDAHTDWMREKYRKESEANKAR